MNIRLTLRNTLRDLLGNPIHKPNYNEISDIYKIGCSDCNKIYTEIGTKLKAIWRS